MYNPVYGMCRKVSVPLIYPFIIRSIVRKTGLHMQECLASITRHCFCVASLEDYFYLKYHINTFIDMCDTEMMVRYKILTLTNAL